MYEIEQLRFSGNVIGLNVIELEYLKLAIQMPIEQIKEFLNLYDSSSPKLDELKFIKNLKEKYSQSRKNVIKRIRQVRKIMNYEKGIQKVKKYIKK